MFFETEQDVFNMFKTKFTVAVLEEYLSHVTEENFTDILEGTIANISHLEAWIAAVIN